MNKSRFLLLPVAILFVASVFSGGQRDFTAEVQSIANRPDVQKALAYSDTHKDQILTEWRMITEIPAPSGQEAKRAAFVENVLKAYGLSDIHIDESGNV